MSVDRHEALDSQSDFAMCYKEASLRLSSSLAAHGRHDK